MILGKRPEQLTDAVDAILSRGRASASEATGDESGDEAVRDEASELAAAFSELRAAHDGVDAPFVFDPQGSQRSRQLVTVRTWRVAVASLAAAAVITLVVLLPKVSDDTVPQLGQLDFVEPEWAARIAAPRSSRMSLVDSPSVLVVRAPRLAIVRSVPSVGDRLGGDVGRRPHRPPVSTVSLVRLKSARLSPTVARDVAPSSFPRSPSMITQPRRKLNDDKPNDDLDRGGSSDRHLIAPERLG